MENYEPCAECGGIHLPGRRRCPRCGKVHVVGPPDPARVRYLALDYECPAPVLRLEYPLLPSAMGRTAIVPAVDKSGREPSERFQGALFAHALTELSGYHVHVGFGPKEHRAGDEDCVVRWQVDEDFDFSPVQLKRLVSAETNASADLERDVNRKLEGVIAPTLHFVWTINREMLLKPRELRLPGLQVAGVWILNSAGPDGTRWHLHGDFVHRIVGLELPYPQ